jgi:hypothetical protein
MNALQPGMGSSGMDLLKAAEKCKISEKERWNSLKII